MAQPSGRRRTPQPATAKPAAESKTISAKSVSSPEEDTTAAPEATPVPAAEASWEWNEGILVCTNQPGMFRHAAVLGSAIVAAEEAVDGRSFVYLDGGVKLNVAFPYAELLPHLRNIWRTKN